MEKPIKMNWENLDLLIEALKCEFSMARIHIFSWGFEKHLLREGVKPFIRCEKHNLIKKIYLDEGIDKDGNMIGALEDSMRWKISSESPNNHAACRIASIFNDQFENKVKAFVCCRDKEE